MPYSLPNERTAAYNSAFHRSYSPD